MLRFKIQGSGKLPYTVTAEGSGASLRMYCTCPAGSRAAMFCKHQQAILLGDVGNLAQPSDDPMALAALVPGSDYAGRALRHVPAAERVPTLEGFSSVEEVAHVYRGKLEERGYVVRVEKSCEPWETQELHCYSMGKHKKLLKAPTLVLEFAAMTGDHVMTASGEIELANIRPRTRPWGVRGRGLDYRSWGDLSRALPHFLSAAGIEG